MTFALQQQIVVNQEQDIYIKKMIKIILVTFGIISAGAYSINPNLIQFNALDNVQAEGLSITGEVKAFLLDVIQSAFTRYGLNIPANAAYITQKLNNSTYGGNWNSIIAMNCTYPSGYGAYSYQGSWWAYWTKVNRWEDEWCYYLTRMPASIVNYANRTAYYSETGQGLTSDEVEVLNKIIEKGYNIYKGSQNGNAFYVSEEAGKALNGSWDVLVLNSTSLYFSSSYSIEEKWATWVDITELKRRYFIRKVWNQS